jgi:MYXO-CTERM domain-containing protein
MATPSTALKVLVALILVLALAPAGALADGDPASDVLLGENVFYPYTPAVPAPIQKTLNAETAAARRSGDPVKVALIASPIDLGVIPDLFGKPQKYAEFLDQEISFRAKQPLLVVMSTGFGVQGLSAPGSAAVSRLAKPAGKTSGDLAQAAITAVARISAAAGHPITGVPGVTDSSAQSGGSSTVPIIAGLAGAAVIVLAALVVLRRRQATTS